MKQILKKIQAKYRKIIKKAKEIGLSLPVFFLVLLTFSTIISVAIIQNRRETTFTRASGNCSSEPKCPSGVGTYMEPAGCEQICGKGNCIACCLSTTKKYYCNAPTNEEDGGYNLPACKGYSYNLQSKCEKELGTSCTQCTTDGASVRWHGGTGQPSQPGSGSPGPERLCSSITCAQKDPSVYTSNTSIWYPNDQPNGPYFAKQTSCKNNVGTKTIAEICGQTTATNTCTRSTCGQLNLAAYGTSTIPVFIDDDGLYYSNEASCLTVNNLNLDKTLVEICGNPAEAQSSCLSSARLCLDQITRYYNGSKNGKLLYFKILAQCNAYINSGTSTGGVNSADEICDPVEPEKEKKPLSISLSTCTRFCKVGTSTCETRAQDVDGAWHKIVVSSLTIPEQKTCTESQTAKGTQFYE